MQLQFSATMRQVGLYLWFAVVLPLTVTGIWFVVTMLIPTLPGWLVFLVLAAGLGMYTVLHFGNTMRDASTLAAQEQQLVQSKQQLSEMYQRSPVPYLTIDNSGAVKMANLAAVRLLQMQTDTIVGINILEHITTEDDFDVGLALGKLDSGVSIMDQEIMLRTATGSMRWVLLSVFVEGVRSNRRLMTMVDITQRKTVDQAKSEFVALASHQLRTPIAAIRWNIELLKNSNLEHFDEKQRGYMEKAEANTARMITLINDFLSVSQLETGTFTAEQGTFDMAEYLNEILDEHNQLITEKGLQVETSFVPPTLSVSGDTRLLHIITSNLVSNATKYTDAGGTIAVAYTAEAGTVTFTVTDTGIGVPESELENLFSKFYRATNARKHKSKGTGLGLYIVKQAVEKMGGGIRVASTEGKGATFSITLPR